MHIVGCLFCLCSARFSHFLEPKSMAHQPPMVPALHPEPTTRQTETNTKGLGYYCNTLINCYGLILGYNRFLMVSSLLKAPETLPY